LFFKFEIIFVVINVLFNRAYANESDIADLLGEFLTRCLFSKTWALREAAVYKVRLLLKEEFEHTPGLAVCLRALVTVATLIADDKIAQVFMIGLGLLDDILKVLKRY
jgi:hypothetical protein